MNLSPTRALVRTLPRSYASHYARRGVTISLTLADRQHQAYGRALEAAGLAVSFVEADESLPDCVFVEDTAVAWDQHALITRMAEHREGEQPAVEAALRRSHVISHLPKGAKLEGGDVLHADDLTYVGLSSRTNQAGAEALRGFLSPFGREVVTVLVSECLHLKTGVTYLGDDTLLAVPGWFDMSRFDVNDVVHAAEGEQGSANCLRIRDRLLMPAGYPETARRVQRFAEAHGVTVTQLVISEFEKGGGSMTCLSLIC